MMVQCMGFLQGVKLAMTLSSPHPINRRKLRYRVGLHMDVTQVFGPTQCQHAHLPLLRSDCFSLVPPGLSWSWPRPKS